MFALIMRAVAAHISVDDVGVLPASAQIESATYWGRADDPDPRSTLQRRLSRLQGLERITCATATFGRPWEDRLQDVVIKVPANAVLELDASKWEAVPAA